MQKIYFNDALQQSTIKQITMTTAMEQALARIELLYGMKPDAIHWEMFKNDCMEKEKEQIINAAKSCNYIGGATNKEAEEYYNQTYNNGTK